MQPSTWNDTNQHWIPQFLLKGFGIHSKSSTIYELDKQTKVVTVRSVREAASKTHLLTDRDDELMRDIESRAAAAVDAIRKGHLNRIGEDHRQAVDRLVCAMILNNPYSGFDAEATRSKVITEEISELSETVKRYGGMLDKPDLRDFFDESLNHDWVSSIMELTSNQVILALTLMGLRACRPTDGEHSIIGDSPVLVIHNAVNGKSSLLNPGTQVILPISSRCILVYAWATEKNVLYDGGTLDRKQVRSLNSYYYHETKCRYVYGRDEEVLKRSRLMSLEWTPRERSNEVNDGWYMMLHLQQIRQRQMAAQDAAQAKIRDYGARELVDIATATSGHVTSPREQRP